MSNFSELEEIRVAALEFAIEQKAGGIEQLIEYARLIEGFIRGTTEPTEPNLGTPKI